MRMVIAGALVSALGAGMGFASAATLYRRRNLSKKLLVLWSIAIVATTLATYALGYWVGWPNALILAILYPSALALGFVVKNRELNRLGQ